MQSTERCVLINSQRLHWPNYIKMSLYVWLSQLCCRLLVQVICIYWPKSSQLDWWMQTLTTCIIWKATGTYSAVDLCQRRRDKRQEKKEIILINLLPALPLWIYYYSLETGFRIKYDRANSWESFPKRPTMIWAKCVKKESETFFF